jgi:transposase
MSRLLYNITTPPDGDLERRFFSSARRDFSNLCRKGPRPTLRPGDIVSSHKGKAVRLLIRAAGAKLLFLPKYSPDLNPIEQVFAKLKHLLCKSAARTIEAICQAIGQLLGTFTPEECTNYFRNSGYALT